MSPRPNSLGSITDHSIIDHPIISNRPRDALQLHSADDTVQTKDEKAIQGNSERMHNISSVARTFDSGIPGYHRLCHELEYERTSYGRLTQTISCLPPGPDMSSVILNEGPHKYATTNDVCH